jgi:hypothetical protein
MGIVTNAAHTPWPILLAGLHSTIAPAAQTRMAAKECLYQMYALRWRSTPPDSCRGRRPRWLEARMLARTHKPYGPARIGPF